MNPKIREMAVEADKLIDDLVKAARVHGYEKSEGFGVSIGISAHEEKHARVQLEMFLAHVLRKLDTIHEVLK